MISRIALARRLVLERVEVGDLGAAHQLVVDLGLYFIVQVPWPTSMLRSTPRFSWDSRV